MIARREAEDHRRWDEEVARLEQLIVEQRAAVAEGRYGDVRGHLLTPGLGPPPASHLARLHAVLQETVAAEQALTNQMETLARRSVAANRAHARAPRRRPLFVDHSA